MTLLCIGNFSIYRCVLYKLITIERPFSGHQLCTVTVRLQAQRVSGFFCSISHTRPYGRRLQRGRGTRPPKKFAWGTQAQASHPPTIATFSKQKLLFSTLTTILVYRIFPYCTTKHLSLFISTQNQMNMQYLHKKG